MYSLRWTKLHFQQWSVFHPHRQILREQLTRVCLYKNVFKKTYIYLQYFHISACCWWVYNGIIPWEQWFKNKKHHVPEPDVTHGNAFMYYTVSYKNSFENGHMFSASTEQILSLQIVSLQILS